MGRSKPGRRERYVRSPANAFLIPRFSVSPRRPKKGLHRVRTNSADVVRTNGKTRERKKAGKKRKEREKDSCISRSALAFFLCFFPRFSLPNAKKKRSFELRRLTRSARARGTFYERSRWARAVKERGEKNRG